MLWVLEVISKRAVDIIVRVAGTRNLSSLEGGYISYDFEFNFTPRSSPKLKSKGDKHYATMKRCRDAAECAPLSAAPAPTPVDLLRARIASTCAPMQTTTRADALKTMIVKDWLTGQRGAHGVDATAAVQPREMQPQATGGDDRVLVNIYKFTVYLLNTCDNALTEAVFSTITNRHRIRVYGADEFMLGVDARKILECIGTNAHVSEYNALLSRALTATPIATPHSYTTSTMSTLYAGHYNAYSKTCRTHMGYKGKDEIADKRTVTRRDTRSLPVTLMSSDGYKVAAWHNELCAASKKYARLCAGIQSTSDYVIDVDLAACYLSVLVDASRGTAVNLCPCKVIPTLKALRKFGLRLPLTECLPRHPTFDSRDCLPLDHHARMNAHGYAHMYRVLASSTKERYRALASEMITINAAFVGDAVGLGRPWLDFEKYIHQTTHVIPAPLSRRRRSVDDAPRQSTRKVRRVAGAEIAQSASAEIAQSAGCESSGEFSPIAASSDSDGGAPQDLLSTRHSAAR